MKTDRNQHQNFLPQLRRCLSAFKIRFESSSAQLSEQHVDSSLAWNDRYRTLGADAISVIRRFPLGRRRTRRLARLFALLKQKLAENA